MAWVVARQVNFKQNYDSFTQEVPRAVPNPGACVESRQSHVVMHFFPVMCQQRELDPSGSISNAASAATRFIVDRAVPSDQHNQESKQQNEGDRDDDDNGDRDNGSDASDRDNDDDDDGDDDDEDGKHGEDEGVEMKVKIVIEKRKGVLLKPR